MKEKKNLFQFYLFLLFLWQLHSQSISAPELSANEFQFYCPGTEQPIVTDFFIKNNGENTAKAIYIQVSSGYEQNKDKLVFKGDNSKINSSWSASEAKLTLTGKGVITCPTPT